MSNPNIAEISKAKSTGPRTMEGKLKMMLACGRLRPWTNSKIVNYFRLCNNCPLRPKITEAVIKGCLFKLFL